ncbi:MAG TPA: 4-(cytidine 5'-diphospho)-2-C-methyl-D-erythritol kinase [Tepidisphaeraceae bacterium]|nr:4-(cytidine 5'-diphospho)-2-C-methyl-D-erythritol kinase [Tepidisphaeraceae bacterium]
MRLLAPAKINLHLRVGPRRADGFHSLLSWMTTVGLFDSLTLEQQAANDPRSPLRTGAGEGSVVERAGSGNTAPIALSCDLPGLPCDERNLVVRIAQAWREEAARSVSSAPPAPDVYGDSPGRTGARAAEGPVRVGGVRATLEKRIPVGAGLGGGSSDAARTLLGLNRLWRMDRAADDLSAFAARFGSDLSFFFYGPSSVCRGRGEIVTPIARPAVGWVVLVLPRLAMPTANVYRRFDEMGLGRDEDLERAPDWNSWASMKSEELLSRLVNDLEPPAFDLAPQLGHLRRRVEEIVKRPVRMSGSGSSLLTLFDEQNDADSAAEHIERDVRERAISTTLSPDFHDDLNAAW